MARWSVQNLNVKGPLAALRPRRLSDLHSLGRLEPLPLAQELRWTIEILRQFAGTIIRHLQAVEAIQREIIVGNSDDALKQLDALEAAEGFSLFSISTRVGVLQVFSGLEAQKDFYASIRRSNAHPNVQFFAYWWSVRAEESSSWQNFKRDFRHRLKAWSVAHEFRAHIAFHMLREVPKSGEEALLLSASYFGSAFDIYETLVALAEVAVEDNRPATQALLSAFSELGLVEYDLRIQKLFFLGQNAPLRGGCSTDVCWRDWSVGNRIAKPDQPPTTIEELQAALSTDAVFENMGNFQARLRASLTEIERPDGEKKGVADLDKLAANFDHTPLGVWLSAFASHPRRINLTEVSTSLRKRFVADPTIGPGVLPALSPDLRPLLLAAIPSPDDSSFVNFQVRLADPAIHSGSDELLSPAMLTGVEIFRSVQAGSFAELLRLAKKLDEVVGKTTHLSLNAEIYGIEGQDGFGRAIAKVTDYLITDPRLANWIPLQSLAQRLISSSDTGVEMIDRVIVLDFAAKFVDQRFGSHRTYAVEDFLNEVGAQKPSDYAATIARDDATDREIYFFEHACVPSALKNSAIFSTERELEDERISLCQWLIQGAGVDDDKLEEEARELVRARHIRQGLKALEGSKLSIDRVGIQRWADRAVREDFQRYMDLLESGIFKVDEEFKDAVYAMVSTGVVSQASLAVPDNEAVTLIAQVITRLMSEFALHPEHGLDAYLSLRIRHGTLSGHLRGPVEQEHLITRRGSDGRYLSNLYWSDRLAGTLPAGLVGAIDQRLSELSKSYDKIIDELTQNLIQVRRSEKPQGLFRAELTAALFNVMIVDIAPGLGFEDFFVRCEEMFWVVVDTNRAEIEVQIDAIAVQVQNLFDEAELDIRSITDEGSAGVRDALVRAKTASVGAVEKITDWLTPPTTPASLTLGAEELIRVSLSVINGFYRDFRPNISFKMDEDLPELRGVVRLFSDIFFIIFENVLKYSGNRVDPNIEIEVRLQDDYLWFNVTNSVEEVTMAEVSRIALAKQRIETGAFRTAVRGEGGTGLPKLAKVIGFGSGGGSLDFSLSTDRDKFSVEFTLRKIDIAGLEDEDE